MLMLKLIELAKSRIKALKILLQSYEKEKFCEIKADFENHKSFLLGGKKM